MAYTPYSYVQLKADGATTNFPFNFPYLDTAHIQVSVDTVVTAFTWVDSYTIKIASAPTAGGVVEIRRITPKDSAIVSFQDGSTLLEADLDLMVTYNLYCAQEAYDGTQASIHLTADGVWDGQGVRGTDFADPVDAQDLMTLNYMNVNFKSTMLAIEQDSIDKTTAIRTTAEANVNASQAAAKASEDAAAGSATAAKASQDAASNSQDAAKASETNAADSEQKAAGYAAGLKLPSGTGEALRLLQQNVSETGLEYGPKVQSSALDATVGALMAVGAFGLGAVHGLPTLADIDTMTTPSGIYRWAQGTGTAPTTYGVVLVCADNGGGASDNWAYQLFFSTDGYMTFRSSVNLSAWSGWSKVYTTADFLIADYLKAGSTHDTTGMRFASANPPAIANITSSGAANALTIGNGSNDYASAVMAFIREGQYACYLGIDTDNVFKVGGWSMGDVSYPIIHAGNLGAYTGQLAVGAVGTYAFMWANGNYAPGTLLAGSAIYYGSYNYQSSVTASGTWMVCGYLSSGYKATVMLRVA
ncbi:phage tail fiber protein [Pseudomonas putida]|uniref:phage tail fiber domain-containing protein n=1 Tax=Pseudomonas putida TaxID=303 RepID=UPI0018D9D444|nr:phage tail fiber protein [Pseudomonas putida]MBH3413653.1 hypothetical protein [Pseudomonas putida]